jgi:hypothetical protein
MNRFRDKMIRCGGAAIICFVLVAGCATSKHVPLETSIDALYRAEQTHDWKSMWALAHARLKQDCSYKEFSKDFQEQEVDIISWTILGIEEIRDPYANLGVEAVKAVKVPMDVTIHYRDSKEAQKAEDQTDYWIQQNGRWIWYYRGWPTD